MTNQLLTDFSIFCYLPSMVICILLWIRDYIADAENGGVYSQSFSRNIFICLCPVLNTIVVMVVLISEGLEYLFNRFFK